MNNFTSSANRYDVIGLASSVASFALGLMSLPGYFSIIESFSGMFMSLQAKIPLLSRFMIGIGDPWVGVILCLLISLGVLFQIYGRSDRIRAAMGVLSLVSVIVWIKMATYAVQGPILELQKQLD